MTIKRLAATSLILSLLASCQSTADKQSTQSSHKDTIIQQANSKPQPALRSHLRDTTYVEGSVTVFLQPDQERYNDLEKTSEGTGDADSDFGIGIKATLDSLKTIPDYKEIKGLTSTKRFILIKDCKGGPRLIDRDTVNYGFIMTAPGMDIDHVYNSVRSGNYLEEIDAYFFGRGI